MPTSIRVDDISVPSDARSFKDDLAAVLGPGYDIQITLQESEWLLHAVEHIKVIVLSPLALTVLAALSREIVGVFFAWVKGRRVQRPEHDHQKLTIYGPDNKAIKVIVVKGDEIEEK
jgi:hypothetical protein